MARIRTVKPELWSDPEFVECSPSARLLFVAALNFASDYGVLPDKPKQLKMLCFPADNIDVYPLVEELVAAGFWVRRTAPDGANVLVIRTFTMHQKVDKPTEGRWGDPADWPETPGGLPEDSPNGHLPIDDESLTEGKGRDICPSIDRFDEFWSAYPRKVARKRAAVAWRNLTKADRAAAFDALPRHIAAWRRERRGTHLIPHPTTWLHDRRWEDDLRAHQPEEKGYASRW